MPDPLTLEQKAEKLTKHLAYLRGEPNGQRADLSGANLRRVNLSGADLSGTQLL